MSVSPIVTQGFGPDIDGGFIVTMGYGGFIEAAKEVVSDIIRTVGKAAKKVVPDILYSVRVSLIEVNGDELTYPIAGSISRLADSSEPAINGTITFVSSSLRQVSESILIDAKPLLVRYFRPGEDDSGDID